MKPQFLFTSMPMTLTDEGIDAVCQQVFMMLTELKEDGAEECSGILIVGETKDAINVSDEAIKDFAAQGIEKVVDDFKDDVQAGE